LNFFGLSHFTDVFELILVKHHITPGVNYKDIYTELLNHQLPSYHSIVIGELREQE